MKNIDASRATPYQIELDAYRNRGSHESFLDAIADPGEELSDDWLVAVTDVVGSTAAISAGKYKEVNVAGALTIMAIGRAFDSLDFPFVFGGDGMTAVVPPTSAEIVRSVLSRAVRDIRDWFGLELRAALIPLADLSDGDALSVSRVRISKSYHQAVFHGPHLSRAEALLKDDGSEGAAISAHRITAAGDDAAGDYHGFSCRWQDIPSHKEHTVALVVSFRKEHEGLEVIRTIDTILSGSDGGFHPLEPTLMAPGGKRSSYKLLPYIDSKGRKGSPRYLFGIIAEALTVAFIRICIRFNIPVNTGMYQVNRIREQNTQSSDFRKFDGGFKMIFAASSGKLRALRDSLEELQMREVLYYGTHVSDAAHMTCIAHLATGDDIHFIDATKGGYAMAAKSMKGQMR